MKSEFWNTLCRQHFGFILLVSIAESQLQKDEGLIFQLKELKTEIQTSTLRVVRGGQLGYSMTPGGLFSSKQFTFRYDLPGFLVRIHKSFLWRLFK